MQCQSLAAIGARLAVCAVVLAPGQIAAQSSVELEQEVREALRRDRDLRRVGVAVTGSEVTLTGELETFWSKSEAIRRTLEVEGVETVASELVIPPPESDEALAEAVGQAIQRYPHYSVFDYLDGGIDTGVVTLWGKVTADRKKADEIFERVAKIQGVQDIRSDIQTMTPSTADRNLRRSIFQAVSRSTHFERVSRARNPPFHIIVERSVVTLVGYVQGEIEYRELERIARQTQGVLRVDNQLQRVQ